MSRNRLDEETSPYLLQHKHNPVHWWPWCEEAFTQARRQNKPVLLSIGYAACHWCHVMAHESFEDQETARVMNRLFVNIKVDREERPDVDTIYMSALHTIANHGGWPLTMFLTPDGEPFWGGTYFPNAPRHGMPAFRQVLEEVARIHAEEPDKVRQNANVITNAVRHGTPSEDEGMPQITEGVVRDLAPRLAGIVDRTHGGIRGAPKFPQYSFFWLLWRCGIRFEQAEAREAVVLTLKRICRGGVYDHLGGGFARYSVDERWLVPHFEKMLYDNALLIELLGEVWRETGETLFAERISETVEWLAREMVTEGGAGAFAASLDADSEGEEGKYYVWTASEIRAVLGDEDAEFFGTFYDVAPSGNWEGKTILNQLSAFREPTRAEAERLSALKARLLAHRGYRVRPGWDDKVLADWNGLMIAALARAAWLFDRPDWAALARQAYGFVMDNMVLDGRLRHSWRCGETRAPATAGDYANMIWAAVRLHELDGPETGTAYLDDAVRLTDVLDKHYWMEAEGGYGFTADDTPGLITRTRSAMDDATPNANAVMISNLAQLFMLTGDDGYLTKAEQTLAGFTTDIGRNLVAHTGALASSLDLYTPVQVAIVGGTAERDGPMASDLARTLKRTSTPGALHLFVADTTHVPARSPLSGKTAPAGQTTGYCCAGFECSLAQTGPEDFHNTLVAARQSKPA